MEDDVSEVKRYDWDSAGMFEDGTLGEYVKYSDYAALQAKADALKASNEAMAKALEYMADEAHWVDPDALLHRPGGAGRQGIYSWSGEVKGWAFSKTALGKALMVKGAALALMHRYAHPLATPSENVHKRAVEIIESA